MICMSDTVVLKPEPWGLHLLGLISPILAIAGNLLGGVYTMLGVIFIWGVGPILDVALGESKILGLQENQELHLKPYCGSMDYCISSCLGHSSFSQRARG